MSDKLKICAEALGYNARIVNGEVRIRDEKYGSAAAINVLWFGAKGDGSTDDTTAIQLAINVAATAVDYPFDPEHNDAQAFELLKWLYGEMTKGDDPRYRADWMLLIWRQLIRGQTLNQAIINAVVEAKK